MDNLPNITNPDLQTEENPMPNQSQKMAPELPIDNEFASKPPLIYPKTIKKYIRNILTTIGVVIMIIALFISGRYIYEITKPQPELPPVTEPDTIDTNPISDTIPLFAYVKDSDEIWTANIFAQDRTKQLEMPKDSGLVISALGWKDQKLLSYAMCGTDCEILTFNLQDKSVTPEVKVNSTQIRKFAWSPKSSYIAFIDVKDDNVRLNLQVGTVNNVFNSFLAEDDPSNNKSRVFFAAGGQYVVYSTVKKEILTQPGRDAETIVIITPVLYVYQLNGTKIDEVENATDPFLINDLTLGYLKDGQIKYRTLGKGDETIVTSLDGFNPEMSPDLSKIIYWRNETNDRVILGLYDSDKGLHRNILRGMIVPRWITNDKVVSIQADSCLGENCLLYQFQTAKLVIVDIDKGDVLSVDQGKSITEVTPNNAN